MKVFFTNLHRMPWERFKFPEGCISWAHRPITAYIYTVDREFDFDKKVAFFDTQYKKNKNYKGRATHTVTFEGGKILVKEVDESEEKQKKAKEKLPKVNDFIDLVGSSRLRDSSSSTSGTVVKAQKPRPQPGVNGAPAAPRRKFRRRGKTPFLTDRDGDDYICLTCKAKDREPWRFKMSQQIAAHVRLHQFNPYRFGDDEDEGEEEDENGNNTNAAPNVPLIDISNEKSVQNNGAEAEFAALISLISISQPSAILETMTPTTAPVVETAPVNNDNSQLEKEKEKQKENPPARSKPPGELNMRSRLTDSLNIDPAEIQRTRDRLAEKEKEAAKANGAVVKSKPKPPKVSTPVADLPAQVQPKEDPAEKCKFDAQ